MSSVTVTARFGFFLNDVYIVIDDVHAGTIFVF
jgi:hypothetical protein